VRIIQEEPLLPAVASYLVNQIQGTKNQIF